ncbi:hypothetical protein [Mycobacterium sp. 852002-50816_SCH5313054-b]|uniref:hypothetical protein n=1 Tax=Mycobacterium sp. 852002-50816_SCH5313054-b TaxID=1834092 RepID=UPI0012E9D01A|nr:hypothetical protein [Mycobacterium sp. 852002-50816_SCH5313054-b]
MAAISCVVFGAKLTTISATGSPMPFFDQWYAEAANLYSPYLKGALSCANLFAPHNEHRIFVFRVFALLHLELAGEWNTRLEMIFGAVVHTAVITWLAALLMPLVAVRRRIPLACFFALLFALPIGYENTLSGFQSSLYLMLFFGIAALVALSSAQPFSVRWFCGLVAAVLSYLSFGSGLATTLAAGALVWLQLTTNARKRCAREYASVLVLASIAVAMILWAASSGHPTSGPWTFVQGLFLFGGQAIIGLVPTVWFCRHILIRRPAIGDRAWLAVGISGWVAIQLLLLAYGRGPAVAVRYLDVVLLVYPVALVAVFVLSDAPRATRFGRYAGPATTAWIFVVVAAFAVLGYVSVVGAIAWGQATRQQEINVQAYLATRNVHDLNAKGGHGQTFDLSYSHPHQLAELLDDRDIRAILPHQFRPPDADNAGVRNRLLLRGRLASGTATVVHDILAIAPALLALGIGLLFAAGARWSLQRAEGTPGGTGNRTATPRARRALAHNHFGQSDPDSAARYGRYRGSGAVTWTFTS